MRCIVQIEIETPEGDPRHWWRTFDDEILGAAIQYHAQQAELAFNNRKESRDTQEQMDLMADLNFHAKWVDRLADASKEDRLRLILVDPQTNRATLIEGKEE